MKRNSFRNMAVAAGAVATLLTAVPAKADWTDDAKVFGGLFADGGTAVVAEYRPDGSFRIAGANGAEYKGCQWDRPCDKGRLPVGAAEAVGWEDNGQVFFTLFGDNTTAVAAEYLEDGGFYLKDEFGNEFSGCESTMPCDDSMPQMPPPEFNGEPVLIITLEPGEELAPLPQIFIPFASAGGMVSAICAGTGCPSVDPSGCSPFESCHIGEYSPNTHSGSWWPTDK